METVDLEQGSADWLEYRYSMRNASEAGVVMDSNPYTTKYQLWTEKQTRESTFTGNVATRHGEAHEEDARVLVSALLGIDMQPAVFKEGLYSASLDGYGLDGNESHKVEIKCPYQGENSKLWQQLQIEGDWKQKIPMMYVWQIIHQHMVCPTTFTWFFCYLPDGRFELIQCFVTEADIALLIEGWERFYAEPPEPDRIKLTDPRALNLYNTRKILKGDIDNWKRQLEAVENELKKLAGNKDAEFEDLKITWVERKGNIDYSKIPDLEGVDTEPYRKDSTKYQKISGG